LSTLTKFEERGVLYVRAILSGGARPHPFTWGLWAVIGGVGATANIAAGGGWGAAILVVWTVLPATVCFIALRRPTNEQRASWLGLGICVIGVFLWLVLANPLAAAIAVTVADISAVWPTLRKTWRDPSSEPRLNWGLDSASSMLSIAGLAVFSPATLLLLVWYLIFNTVMFGLASRGHTPDTSTLVGLED